MVNMGLLKLFSSSFFKRDLTHTVVVCVVTEGWKVENSEKSEKSAGRTRGGWEVEKSGKSAGRCSASRVLRFL